MTLLKSLNQKGRTSENTYELVELWILARRATSHEEKEGECFAPCLSIFSVSIFSVQTALPLMHEDVPFWGELQQRKMINHFKCLRSLYFLNRLKIWCHSWKALEIHENEMNVFQMTLLKSLNQKGRTSENTYKLVELWILARRATSHQEKEGECFAPCMSIFSA